MSHCEDPVTCPEGNCPGCKNGQLFCSDPRCSPYCPQCPVDDSHHQAGNLTFLLIILGLASVLAIFWFAYGPSFFYPVIN